MDWTDKEIRAGQDAGRSSGAVAIVTSPEGVAAIMTRAVELVRARGGTMTAGALEGDLLTVSATHPDTGERIRQHVTTQGATVVTLQAKVGEMEGQLVAAREDYRCACETRESLSAEVERLKEDLEGAHDQIADTAKAWQEVEKLKEPLPTELHLAVDAWLRANRLSPEQVRHGLFPLGMVQRWMERAVSAESRLAATRERVSDSVEVHKRAEAGWCGIVEWDEACHADARSANALPYLLYAADSVARWVLEGDAPNSPGIPDGSRDAPQEANTSTCYCAVNPETPCFASRHPCSDTCTHEDAANPGHPERIASLSVAFDQPMPETGVLASDESPERVKARREAFTKEAVLAFTGCQNDRERVCYAAGREGGLDEGADAMRAACLTVCRDWLVSQGYDFTRHSGRDLIEKIEGAAP